MRKRSNARMTASAAAVLAAVVGAPLLVAPAAAADGCSGTAPFDWATQWDDLFAQSQAWQYPETGSCLDHGNGLGRRKLDGKLYQKDQQITFSTDSGPLKRSELRSYTITSATAKVSGTVFIRTTTSDKTFTVAQLLNAEPSLRGGGQDPIVRLEVDGGALHILYYERNGSPAAAPVRNVRTSLNEGSSFSFEIRQYKSSSKDFDVEVLVDGKVVLQRTVVRGYDDEKGYFKAGCYVNTDGGSGCRSSFSRLSFEL